MRLIDAGDLINNLVNACNNDQSKFLPVWIEKQIDTQSTIDAVSVVRCRDCKWFNQAFKSEGRCLKHDSDYHEPGWFCADGERKGKE